MKIYLRRIYYRVKERDHSYPHSVVVYDKKATLFDTVNRGPHPEGQFMAAPVRWRHYLHIDLWLVILDFDWTSGRHKDL